MARLNLAIHKGGVTYVLPRPITDCQVMDGWDFQEKKAVKADGGQISGVSRKVVRVQFVGGFGINTSDTKTITEDSMFDEWKTLRDKLNVDNEEKFEFFVAYNSSSPTYYLKFKQCSAESLVLLAGDDDRIMFRYQGTIVSEDTTVYTTAPGV